MYNFYHIEEYKGYCLTIEQDDNPEDPRQWDNVGVMVTDHPRYLLGDRRIGDKPRVPYLDTPSGFMHWLEAQSKLGQLLYLPLYLHDHSVLSMSTGSFIGRAQHAEWDSGLVGFIYVTREKIQREFGWKLLTSKRKEFILGIMREEVAVYSKYISGECYVWVAWTGNPETNPTAVRIDSVLGYFDLDYAIQEAKATIDCYVEREKKHGLQLILPGTEDYLVQEAQIIQEKLK